jgi:type II secretory pathway pseudopilin PulG
MKKSRRRQGSALIIALIVVIIVVGIGGAFLVDTMARGKMSHSGVQSDEAQMICEAALEKVRRALFVYKDTGSYDWNDLIFDHAGMSIDPDTHWNDYLSRKDDSDFVSYAADYDQAGVNTAEDAPMPADPDHFLGISKPFGEGAFTVVIRDNDDGDADPAVDSDSKLLVYVAAVEAIESKLRLINRVAEEARRRGMLALAASLDHDAARLEMRILSIRHVLSHLS